MTTQPTAYLIINTQVFPITKPVTTIGRKLENDLVIQEILVSRYHAEIHVQGDRHFLHDLGSTSGTFVNNHRVEIAELKSDDLIQIAEIPIIFLRERGKLVEKSTRKTDSLEKKGSQEPVS